LELPERIVDDIEHPIKKKPPKKPLPDQKRLPDEKFKVFDPDYQPPKDKKKITKGPTKKKVKNPHKDKPII